MSFTCTNPTQIKAHPHFTWINPDWPPIRGGRNLTIYYKIFRNDSEIEDYITNQYWTVDDVVIHPNGPSYTYYVKAHLSNSPESDPSNSYTINSRGSIQIGEQYSNEPENYQKNNK